MISLPTTTLKIALLSLLALIVPTILKAEDVKVLTPAEAREKIGEEATVEFQVKSAKDLLETRGSVYLDSEESFRDPTNFAVAISKKGAASLKEKMIEDLATYYKGKKIRVTGKIEDASGIPRIKIDDASKIEVVAPATE